MTNQRRQAGFIFILMLATVIISAVVMFCLSRLSSCMVFESDSAYLNTTSSNLTASAAAWARVNARDPEFQGTETVMDVNDLGYREASLIVHVEPADGALSIGISGSCSKRRRVEHFDDTFALPRETTAPTQESSPQN